MWNKLKRMIHPKEIVIVSGLPRSGTSMMMKMLEAGGVPPLTDKLRTADADNPKGYYEFERVKKMPEGDTAWLPDARGKAVKVISALLKQLPPEHAYKIIFMRRKMDEILASQQKMLIRRGKEGNVTEDEKMAELFRKHLQEIEEWLAQQPNMEVCYVSYNDILATPVEQISRLNRFLGGILDEAEMAAIVDPTLYRQRRK